jgi:hypothetical protein
MSEVNRLMNCRFVALATKFLDYSQLFGNVAKLAPSVWEATPEFLAVILITEYCTAKAVFFSHFLLATNNSVGFPMIIITVNLDVRP